MKKLLIIEDDPIVSRIYKTRLEREGYTVETATDGQSGLLRIHEFNPDTIILDLMLPNMNGIEILKKIRAKSQFAHIPIIVFTNAYIHNMIQEAFAVGASHVFNKATLTPRQILDSLHSLSNSTDRPSQGPPPKKAGLDLSHELDYTSTFSAPRAKILNEVLDLTQPVDHEHPPSRKPNNDESDFHDELHRSFFESSPQALVSLRKLLQELTKAQSDAERGFVLGELYRRVHALTGSAGIIGLEAIAQMAAALEVLIRELQEKPKNITGSTLRTVAHSIDFISELFSVRGDLSRGLPRANILVVDDEILSRRAVAYALEKANLQSVNIDDPSIALTMATQHEYDLIFLDVQMPGMDGFELCSKIRALAKNRATPIIFITSLTDFRSRARSTLSGGTDLIAKPFMFIELTVKALTQVLRGHYVKTQSKKAA